MISKSTPAPCFKPAAFSERIERIDVLRGLALFGVLAANLILANRVMVRPEPAVSLGMAALDPIADAIYVFFIRGKAYSLFAFLFGLGFALQLSRAEERGAAHVPVFLRRMVWLLVFGAAHLLLLWWGDILHVYALGGLALLAFRRASDRTLLVLGLVLTGGYGPGLWAFRRLFPPHPGAASQHAGVDVGALREGGYGEVLVENFRVVARFLEPGMLVAIVAASLGLFLLGFWVGRGRWLAAERLEGRPFVKILGWGLVVGVPLNVVVVGYRVFDWGDPMSVWHILSQTLGVPALAASYLALVALLFERPAWRRRLIWLAPVGRMALTLYLMHSFFFFGLLYGAGPGLGLVGRVGPALALLIAVAIFAFQVLLSRWWLERYRFGPAEWLWRRLTYGAAPALGKGPSGRGAVLRQSENRQAEPALQGN